MSTIHLCREQPDVFIDACAADTHGQLLFLSLLGRDTSVQQFFARIHQTSSQGGIDELNLVEASTGSDGSTSGARKRLRLLVGDPRRLQKISARLPRARLLGQLVQAWVFDPRLSQLGAGSGSAWVFQRQGEEREDRLWALVQELSPVPLLPLWRDAVMDFVQLRRGIAQSDCLGAVQATSVELPADFVEWVSTGVREGRLAVGPL